jgi:hypothetical protein
MTFLTPDERSATFLPVRAQVRRAELVLKDLRRLQERLERLPRRIRCIDGKGYPTTERHLTKAYYHVRDGIEDMEREMQRPVAVAMRVFADWDPVVVEIEHGDAA